MMIIISNKISSSFLFLVFTSLLLCTSFFVRAQNRTSVTSLKGFESDSNELAEVYVGPASLLLNGGISQPFYIFKKPSTFILRIVTNIPGRNQTRDLFNMGTGRYESRTVPEPPISTFFDQIGTYRQQGNKIRIFINNETIEAKIVEDGLEGTLTRKDNVKEGWAAVKGSGNTDINNSISSGNNSAYPNQAQTNINKYSASLDSPMIGSWKNEEGCSTQIDFLGNNSTTCKRTAVFDLSQDGHFQLLVGGYLIFPETFYGNWRYTPEDKSSGIIEFFDNGKLVEKGSIKFSGKSQFQFTVTFNINSAQIGKTSIWNKK